MHSSCITVEPLTNDHPHQRPSLSYDHISCDGLWFLFVYESLTSDHPSYTTTPMWFWGWSYKRGSTVVCLRSDNTYMWTLDKPTAPMSAAILDVACMAILLNLVTNKSAYLNLLLEGLYEGWSPHCLSLHDLVVQHGLYVFGRGEDRDTRVSVGDGVKLHLCPFLVHTVLGLLQWVLLRGERECEKDEGLRSRESEKCWPHLNTLWSKADNTNLWTGVWGLCMSVCLSVCLSVRMHH